ncbi:MAG: hypothetical protein KGL53_01575, partial [Elusimicrobia bacterium]|nr:hypothetical protein [Elusimicrobiota bacterium]
PTGGCGLAGAEHAQPDEAATLLEGRGGSYSAAVLSRVASTLAPERLSELLGVLHRVLLPGASIVVFDDGLGVDGETRTRPEDLGAPLAAAGWSARPLRTELEGLPVWLWAGGRRATAPMRSP